MHFSAFLVLRAVLQRATDRALRPKKPHECIRYTDKFDDTSMPGEIQVTILLRAVACGAEIDIVQEGLPAAIPVELC